MDATQTRTPYAFHFYVFKERPAPTLQVPKFKFEFIFATKSSLSWSPTYTNMYVQCGKYINKISYPTGP